MSDKSLSIIEQKLDLIEQKLDLQIRLLALGLVAGKKQQDQIVLLNGAGFQPKQIAEMLGTTANSIRVRLSNLRTRRKKGA